MTERRCRMSLDVLHNVVGGETLMTVDIVERQDRVEGFVLAETARCRLILRDMRSNRRARKGMPAAEIFRDQVERSKARVTRYLIANGGVTDEPSAVLASNNLKTNGEASDSKNVSLSCRQGGAECP